MLNRTEQITRVVTIFGLLLTAPFLMAPIPVFMTVPEYPGSVEQVGREGTNEGFSFEHNIEIEFDPVFGTTGRRIHHPLVIQKAIDRSTPGFYEAMVQIINLPEIKFDFYRPSRKGLEEKYFVVTLNNAHIVGMRNFFPNTLLPENAPIPHMEEVTFVYETITWEWLPDGFITQDTWRGEGP